MNERIKQLRTEAMQYANSTEIGDIYKDWYSAFEGKFAELIVEDSIGVLVDYLEEIDKEQKTPTFIGMAITISRIREHFGVES